MANLKDLNQCETELAAYKQLVTAMDTIYTRTPNAALISQDFEDLKLAFLAKHGEKQHDYH